MDINLAYRTLMQMHGESVERDQQYVPDDTLIDWRPKPRLKVTPQPPPQATPQQPAQKETSKSGHKSKKQSGGPFVWRWHYSVIVLPVIWLTAIITLQFSQREPDRDRIYVSDPETTLPRPKPVKIQTAQAGIATMVVDTSSIAVQAADSLSNPVQ